MSSDFSIAVQIVLKNEGGLEINSRDSGGITNFGISQSFLNNSQIDTLAQDITESDAIAIYHDYFWNKYNIGSIANQDLANKVFDAVVNMGPYEAIFLLQSIVNDYFLGTLVEDGALGPKTAFAINICKMPEILEKYKAALVTHYENIVSAKPSLNVFLDGWIARANE